MQSRGLHLSLVPPFPAEVANCPKTDDLRLLGSGVALWLYFIERDGNLHHALKSVRAFGVGSLLDLEQREPYTDELLLRFRRAVQADTGLPTSSLWGASNSMKHCTRSFIFPPSIGSLPGGARSNRSCGVPWIRPSNVAGEREFRSNCKPCGGPTQASATGAAAIPSWIAASRPARSWLPSVFMRRWIAMPSSAVFSTAPYAIEPDRVPYGY